MNLSAAFSSVQAHKSQNVLVSLVRELERQRYRVVVDHRFQDVSELLDDLEKRDPLVKQRSFLFEMERDGVKEKSHFYVFTPQSVLFGGEQANFIYRVVGANIEALDLDKLNRSDASFKIARRIKELRARGYLLEFVGVESSNLFGNLQLIDTALPEILAHLLVYKYAGDAPSKFLPLIEHLKQENPLGFYLSDGHPFYEYKLKRFLVDAALGMVPSEIWKGEFDATGGIIVVKKDGDVVCYHIYNYNEFESYLLKNTRLEQASTTRYKFGDVYRVGPEVFLKLNLQVRFT